MLICLFLYGLIMLYINLHIISPPPPMKILTILLYCFRLEFQQRNYYIKSYDYLKKIFLIYIATLLFKSIVPINTVASQVWPCLFHHTPAWIGHYDFKHICNCKKQVKGSSLLIFISSIFCNITHFSMYILLIVSYCVLKHAIAT